MADKRTQASVDLGKVLAESYAVSEQMNQLVLEHLDSAAWRAKLPGSKGRDIASIFSHVHNMRRKWLRLTAPHLALPTALDRTRCTQKQAQAALAESGTKCFEMITEALCNPQKRIRKFQRDGWARAWPAGAAMVAYMITHDAHHRGQVCLLAHQLGLPLAAKAGVGMWGWEKLWKECGFGKPR